MEAKVILFTRHARFELKRRGIRQTDVVTAISYPRRAVPSRNGQIIFQYRIGPPSGMWLRVVIKDNSYYYAYRVITAYKTSKVAK